MIEMLFSLGGLIRTLQQNLTGLCLLYQKENYILLLYEIYFG